MIRIPTYFIILILFSLLSCKVSNKDSDSNAKSDYYSEPHRPQYHFSPEANWMNDPNGMVYYEGEYHLFYQYYPDSTVWGPMHWGHAVSTDMVSWEHLPIALFPDSLGYIFSGSAVVDEGNTSGFGINGRNPIIAIFTHHNMDGEKSGGNKYQYQSIAYSNDNGRTFTKYEGNPVIPNPGIKDFRDPKVIWDEKRNQWVMVFAAYDKVMFYTSPNLKEWTYTGEFGISGDKRLWECPDLFPIDVEGTEEEMWVLITSIQKEGPNGGTATGYFVGDFDGQTFIGNNKNQKWLDYGTDNYALVTWSDIPESDGRKLALGWMSNWEYAQVVPTKKWRSAMTLPRSLTLHKEGNDYQLRSLPVKELVSIEGKSIELDSQTYLAETIILNNANQSLYKLDLSFEKPEFGGIEIVFSNSKEEYISVGYSTANKVYSIDRTFAGENDFSKVFADYHEGEANYDHPTVDMVIYLDHSSIELFADKGQCVMTEIFFPSEPFTQIEINADVNNIRLEKGKITELKSIWK